MRDGERTSCSISVPLLAASGTSAARAASANCPRSSCRSSLPLVLTMRLVSEGATERCCRVAWLLRGATVLCWGTKRSC